MTGTPNKKRYILAKWVLFLILTVLLIAIGFITILEQQLPNVDALKNVQMQVPLQIFTADGKLMAEFGEARRIPVELKDIPPLMINAVIATEDKRFYEHSGVDVISLGRAAYELFLTGKKSQGGSTITMQVARNFFLSPQKTYIRKIREILLSMKISHELSKEKVLELYFNKVYFGNRAYGIAAAAQVYYGKSLNQLTLAEMAMLAGLPQAPSAINPVHDAVAAKERRAIVLQNMLDQHYINQQQYHQAIQAPVNTEYHHLTMQLNAPYVAEEVRDELVSRYGDKAYTDGFNVYTTINSTDQLAAAQALRTAVIAYDHRHGYRRATQNWGTPDPDRYATWQNRLKNIAVFNGLQPAAVLTVSDQQATALMANGHIITIPWSGISWAQKQLGNGKISFKPKTAADVLTVGDVIYVDKIANSWQLSQVPQAEGAFVAMNPNDGAILAMVGGFSFNKSTFNRAEQAERQPGSGFKPYLYSAALDKGYTLATIMNDAPIVEQAGDQVGLWRPQNDEREFLGPIRLRVALAQSRNLVSIRLLQQLGVDDVLDYVKRFGFGPTNFSHTLSLALGVAEITILQQAIGYSVFANGGYKVEPYLINKITNSNTNAVFYQATPVHVCPPVVTPPTATATPTSTATVPATALNPSAQKCAVQAISPQTAYLMTSAMQSVIKEGTGSAALVLGRGDIAGKTGSTNDLRDGWFNGFNSDIVAIAWMGFDQPQSLYEHGAQAALPMWIDFMRQALKGKPEHTMARPDGLVSMRIDTKTGLAASPTDANAIFETFRATDAPQAAQAVKATNDTEETNNSNSAGQPLY